MNNKYYYNGTYTPKGWVSFDNNQNTNVANKNSEKKLMRFLSAAKSISEDMIRLDSKSIDHAKLCRFTANVWKQSGGELKGKIGCEQKCFVSRLTPEGVEINMQIFDEMCGKVIVICDKTGACSRIIVDRIRRYALGSGYDIISCMCPMNVDGSPEHIIIPELKLGIFSSKYYHRADFKNVRKVFAARFHSPERKETKQRVDFSLKAYRSLMDEVFSLIQNCL